MHSLPTAQPEVFEEMSAKEKSDLEVRALTRTEFCIFEAVQVKKQSTYMECLVTLEQHDDQATEGGILGFAIHVPSLDDVDNVESISVGVLMSCYHEVIVNRQQCRDRPAGRCVEESSCY